MTRLGQPDADRIRRSSPTICTALCEHVGGWPAPRYQTICVRGPLSAADFANPHAADADERLFIAGQRLYGVRKLWHAMRHLVATLAAIRWAG